MQDDVYIFLTERQKDIKTDAGWLRPPPGFAVLPLFSAKTEGELGATLETTARRTGCDYWNN